MPARLKAFLEQVFRPGFAFEYQKSGGIAKKLLTSKSACVVITMGIPGFVYQWALSSLQRALGHLDHLARRVLTRALREGLFKLS